MLIQYDRVLCERNPMLYGQFLEHFHRQIYGGVYCPESILSDDKGFRKDVIEALRQIGTNVIRWPGGCFASAYHWRDGVGSDRLPSYDKAWKVEESNTFGTAEFYELCKAIGSEMYICSNAGTGTPEEMSDWLEYCNLENEGRNAKARISHGFIKPFKVKYFSIGNENYGSWEIGAYEAKAWGRLVAESAKMLLRADPDIELSAAALPDPEWNMELLKHAGQYLKWISIHQYWDAIHNTNDLASYEQCMAYTADMDSSIEKTLGILTATGNSHIKIAFDEWNLRGWYHPNIHTVGQTSKKEDYLTPRDKNDDNSSYTMADTIFTACFLNTLHRHAKFVQMANYAPAVNTRGLIFTHKDGIVKRGTYHVFNLFYNHLGCKIIDCWQPESMKMNVNGRDGVVEVDVLDVIATKRSDGAVALSLINKHPDLKVTVPVSINGFNISSATLYTIKGNGIDDYNDIAQPDNIRIERQDISTRNMVTLSPHSVNVLVLQQTKS